MRQEEVVNLLAGCCSSCDLEVDEGRGVILDGPPRLLCVACALATAPSVGLGERQARLAHDPPEVAGELWTFSDYQAEGAFFLATRWQALLTDDKGLGKTAQALLAIPTGAPVVVVCPAQVKAVWLREFGIWRPEYELSLLSGRSSWSAPGRGEAVILNYEILPPALVACECSHPEADHAGQGCSDCECQSFRGKLPSATEVRRLLELTVGTVLIIDEAHKAKSPISRRTRRVRFLARGCERVWGLTASPMMNHPDELWTLYRVLGLAVAAFGKRRTFNWLFRRYEFGAPPDTAEGVEIQARRARVELGRSAEDVELELPELRFEERIVTLGPEARAEIDAALCHALAARRAQDAFKAGEITKEEIPTHTELLRCTSATDADVLELVEKILVTHEWSAIAEDVSRLKMALAIAKIPGALRYAQECREAGEPLVAYSAHVLPVETLGGQEGWASLRNPNTRAASIERFQNGELAGVALGIRVGEGITLHRARLALLVDRDWTPEANDQAAKRIHRRGQRRGCLVTTLVADHPLDHYVGQTLARKTALIRASTRRNVR